MTYTLPSSTRLSNSMQLQKRQTSTNELACWIPISVDGKDWLRVLISDRFNPTPGSGSIQPAVATLSKLYVNDLQSVPTANVSSGTQRQAFSSTVDYANFATKYASEAGPDAFGSYYTTTVGETAGATNVTVPEGGVICWRGSLNTSVGGQIKVSINVSGGSGIDSSYYLWQLDGSDYIAELDGETTAGDEAVIPMTHPLPAGDYDITFTNHEDTTRAYCAGIGILVPDNTLAGPLGTLRGVTAIGGVATSRMVTPGASVIYEFDDVTEVKPRVVTNNQQGNVLVEWYDASGALLGSDTVDNYRSTQNLLFLDSAIATYATPQSKLYVKLTLLGTKNASSGDYQLRLAGAIGNDTTQAGTVGTHDFDDLNALDSVAIADNDYKFWPTGAAAWTAKVALPGSLETLDFVGGGHGHEASSSVTYEIDDVDVTASIGAAAQYDVFTGSKFEIIQSTIISDPTDSNQIFDADYHWTFDRNGVRLDIDLSVRTSETVHVWQHYACQFGCPSRTAGTAAEGLAGGFNKLLTTPPDAETNYPTDDDSVNYLSDGATIGQFFNAQWLFQGELLNGPTIQDAYGQDRIEPSVVPRTTDNHVKLYLDIGERVSGVEIDDTFTLTTQMLFRAASLADVQFSGSMGTFDAMAIGLGIGL